MGATHRKLRPRVVLHQQSAKQAQVRLQSMRALTPARAKIDPPATSGHRLAHRRYHRYAPWISRAPGPKLSSDSVARVRPLMVTTNPVALAQRNSRSDMVATKPRRYRLGSLLEVTGTGTARLFPRTVSGQAVPAGPDLGS